MKGFLKTLRAAGPLYMRVAPLTHGSEKWPRVSVDDVLYFVLTQENRSCPYFRPRVAVVEQKYFYFRIDHRLSIFGNGFDAFVSSNDDPVIFAAFLDPFRIGNPLIRPVWIDFIDRLQSEFCFPEDIHQTLTRGAVNE